MHAKMAVYKLYTAAMCYSVLLRHMLAATEGFDMDQRQRPIIPRKKAERCVTLAAALLVLIGGMLAVAAWHRSHQPPPVSTAPAPVSTPEPAGPLAGWTILVDPGHGGYDGGARCRDSGIWEKHLNLAVALKVEQALAQRGARVIMTRREDVDLVEADRPASVTKKRQDMQNRVDMADHHRQLRVQLS